MSKLKQLKMRKKMINKVILQGRLSDDPELKQTVSGDFVCTIFLVNQRRFNKDSDSKIDVVKCEAWGDNAQFVARYLKKGNMVDIEGNIRCKKWKDQYNKIRVDQFVYIDNIRYSTTNMRKDDA